MKPMAPQPTDIAEKLIAYRRRTASKSSKALAKDSDQQPQRKQQPTPPTKPDAAAATADDFSRRLNISSTSSTRPSKLFNPERDPIPTIRRTAEPEPMPDVGAAASSSSPRNRPDSSPRQLFDHRKDDPVRFSVLARPNRPTPTPKSSGDYISASSSSYAPSQASSTFTLSSTTDGSSASSALFENQGKPSDDQGTSNAFALQLKKLYRTITNLEAKIKQDDADENELANEGGTRVMLKSTKTDDEDLEKEKWKTRLSDHKRLVEVIQNLLEISLAPSVPASLRNIPTKYNIIARLWTFGFYKLLESLRRASFPASSASLASSPYPQHSYALANRGSQLALEHLNDFLLYAYTFYTGLLEEPRFASFRNHWLEALGDLARYKMMVEGFLERREKETTVSSGSVLLTVTNLEEVQDVGSRDEMAPAPPNPSGDGTTRNSDKVSGEQSNNKNSILAPSVGLHAAYLLSQDMEAEKERWRAVARDWYGMGLSDQPGAGKLHHHIGLLCREVVNGGTFAESDATEILKGLYHYAKSMTTLHPFSTSRESILPLFSPFLQQNSPTPTTPITLFILLHGMLFTNINLDAFDDRLARFIAMIESLKDGQVEEREWVMMGVVNVAATLEYGKSGGLIRRCMGGASAPPTAPSMAGPSRANKREREVEVYDDPERMDVDDTHTRSTETSPTPAHLVSAPSESFSPALLNALKLTFFLFSYALKNPFRRASQYSHRSVNPYTSILLTFLSTSLKTVHATNIGEKKTVLDVVEQFIPWSDLATFLSTKIPRSVWESQRLISSSSSSYTPCSVEERWVMLTSGTSPPLPEDWCLRGMEWVGRKVYERGFWKSNGGEDEKFARVEVEYLCESERGKGDDGTDGKIEDDDDETPSAHPSTPSAFSRAGGVPMILSSNGSRGGTSVDVSLMPPPRRNLSPTEISVKRFIRIIRCGVIIAAIVPGFSWVEGSREFIIASPLKERIQSWEEDERARVLEEETRRLRLNERRTDVDGDIEIYEDALSSEESTDDEDSLDEELKALKARRRYLKSLLQASKKQPISSSPPRRKKVRTGRAPKRVQTLSILPGYTILVIDTNILLASLPDISSLVESLRWTVIVPGPVVMELEGLALNTTELGDAAKQALSFISSKVKTHSVSLKVQTTKGNYLNTVDVVTEDLDFSSASDERNMDDLILKTAAWQQEHWADRSLFLNTQDRMEVENPIKVLILSLDRNLRLKARSRQLAAASEKDLALVLKSGT